MLKKIIFFRHLKGNVAAAYAAANELKELFLKPGMTVAIFASSDREAKPTANNFKQVFGSEIVFADCLAASAPYNPVAVTTLVSKRPAELVLLITHENLAGRLPGVFAQFYHHKRAPKFRYYKPGQYSVIDNEASRSKQRKSAMEMA